MNTKNKVENEIKILIFCISEIILDGIQNSLSKSQHIKITHIESNTMESFMDSLKKNKPDIVLFANSEFVPNISEICKAVKDFSKPKEKCQLLLLGTIPSHEEVVNLLNAGARGYFDLNSPSDKLPEAIETIYKGDIWLPRDKMSSIMDRIISVVGKDFKDKPLDQLTPTEFQVLRLIGQGKSNDEIAATLFISKNTVRSHIKSIYSKLNTHSRLQLALYAINSALF
ncbi:MAG: response regulator transcription factor [Candidatus Aminicenantes bacterium]|nr:response regulator transcription factor [Candidatus Aminicenantes bacterium]